MLKNILIRTTTSYFFASFKHQRPGAFLWYNEASLPNLCPDMAKRASRQHIRHVCQCRSNHGLRNGYRERRLSQSRSNLPSFPSVGRVRSRQVTQNINGKVGKEKYLLLLRQYQEEMLEAYLTESEDFKDLLHYCNIMYNALPMLLRSTYDFHTHLDARKLAAITIVAGGYGGDMPEDQAYDLLDDIDFYYNKVKCRKIEKLLPVLSKLVIQEQKYL